MRTQSSYIVILVSALFLSNWALSAPSDSCEKSGRNTSLCFKMKRLWNDVNFLDSQRDLMQTNFPLLAEIAHDMDLVITKLLIGSGGDSHLSALSEVRTSARDLSSLAGSQRLSALKTANEIRGQCLICHSNTTPQSGHRWDEIAGMGWETIMSTCNSSSRNPYVCKSMYGMLTGLRHLNSGEPAGVVNYEAFAEVGQEISRIASDLGSKGIEHANGYPMSSVQVPAAEIVRLARNHDPAVLRKSRQLDQSCLKCHLTP